MVKTKGEQRDLGALPEEREERTVEEDEVANDVRTKILAATSQIAKTEGLDAATPTRIYAATGIARSTVYRHWPKRVELLRAAIEEDEQLQQTEQRRASSPAIALRLAAESFNEESFMCMLASVMSRADAGGDDAVPEWRDLAGWLVRSRLQPFFEFVDQMFEDGRIRSGVDRDQLLALCLGPMIYHRLIHAEKVPEQLVERQTQLLEAYFGEVAIDAKTREA